MQLPEAPRDVGSTERAGQQRKGAVDQYYYGPARHGIGLQLHRAIMLALARQDTTAPGANKAARLPMACGTPERGASMALHGLGVFV